MTHLLRRGASLGALALLIGAVSGCAVGGRSQAATDAPPPPRLTTVASTTPRVAEGPLSPVPGIDPAPKAAPGSDAMASAIPNATAPPPKAEPISAGATSASTPDLQPLSRGAVAANAIAAVDDSDDGAGAAGRPVDPLDPGTPPDGKLDPQLDLWQRVRDGYRMPDLQGRLVADHERWYASRADYVKRMTERGGRYLYHVLAEIERRRMPTELALLPFIESAFNPQAMSVAKASGMWQFIPSTGRDYDLKQNVFRDDRRDVLASTRAALDYLSRLNAEFNDWQLSLAAYNWGEGNVRRAIARNRVAGLPTDYESLRMPDETRSYVPKLQAVKNIVSNPQAYGLALPPLKNHPYFMSVPIKRDIDVALAAQLAGLGLEEFKTLNPQMNKPVILAAGTPQILLPFDNADDFVTRLEAHKGRLASWTAWVVPRTMRPAEAARAGGLDEATLREVNRIPPRMLVKAGSTLLVPRPPARLVDVPEHLADNAQMALAPDLPPLRKVAIKARKGDTVASLASRHKVSPTQLAQWNRLSPGARFAAGQDLVIYRAVKAAKPRKVAAAGR